MWKYQHCPRAHPCLLLSLHDKLEPCAIQVEGAGLHVITITMMATA
jgi:hypothetical protein